MDKIDINDKREVWCLTCGGFSNYDPKFKKNLIDERITNACCKKCYIEYRLFKGVDRTQHGCQEFQGAYRGIGYGAIKVDGKIQYAHRTSYELGRGKLEHSNIMVRHTCDNPRCINPNHLIEGLAQENTHDCISRGRYMKNKNLKKVTLNIIKEHQPVAINTIFDLSGAEQSSVKRAIGTLKREGLIKVADTGNGEVKEIPVPYYVLHDRKQPQPSELQAA